VEIIAQLDPGSPEEKDLLVEGTFGFGGTLA
jgi:hypothetical protein